MSVSNMKIAVSAAAAFALTGCNPDVESAFKKLAFVDDPALVDRYIVDATTGEKEVNRNCHIISNRARTVFTWVAQGSYTQSSPVAQVKGFAEYVNERDVKITDSVNGKYVIVPKSRDVFKEGPVAANINTCHLESNHATGQGRGDTTGDTTSNISEKGGSIGDKDQGTTSKGIGATDARDYLDLNLLEGQVIETADGSRYVMTFEPTA